MIDIENIKSAVAVLLADNHDGHGMEHTLRVLGTALRLARAEKADEEIVALAALLHDVDDYKIFGEECALCLTHAREILSTSGIEADKAESVCAIIGNMGYNKFLRGVRPQSIEGKVVSDADMLDAIGAHGIIRCLAFALERCNNYGTPVFDSQVFPEKNLCADTYKKSNRRGDNFINHFFDKLLRLKDIMLTASGKAEALEKHDLMVMFLRQFFQEENVPEWLSFLNEFDKKS